MDDERSDQLSSEDSASDPFVGLEWHTATVGTPKTTSFRLLFLDSTWCPFSAWLDFPLHSPQGFFNAICATPRGSAEKLELALTDPFHPLSSQGTQGGLDDVKLAYAHPTPCHVCFASQTWQDPEASDPRMGPGIPGDGRPICILDISEEVRPSSCCCFYWATGPCICTTAHWRLWPMSSAQHALRQLSSCCGTLPAVRSGLLSCRSVNSQCATASCMLRKV